MEKCKKLKYLGYTIACQEVPNEISLIINISGCPHHCEGCHSQYLWEYEGKYISDELDDILKEYEGLISCVCFMGGDQNINELNEMLKHCIDVYGLKTCVYSGYDDIDIFDLSLLNYLKIGKYDATKGGLNSTTTNQKFYVCENKKLEDVTYLFNKKRK